MANIRLENLSSTGTFVNGKATELGEILTMDWKQRAAIEGRVFTTTVGTLSTGIVGGGNGTVLDLDQPEFLISVPDGAIVVPLSFNIQGNAADAVADHSVLEALICCDINYKWNADGTYTAETAYSTKTRNGRTSLCQVASAFTADMTASSGSDTTHHIDLAREEVKIDLPANGETPIILSLRWNPDPAPLIYGPALITGYWGGTSAVTGYAQLYWAEYLPSELF